MRTILTSCVLLVVMTTGAMAQQPHGQQRLSPAVGVAVGVSGRLDERLTSNGNHEQLKVSGTFDFPLTSNGWIRIEGCKLPRDRDGMRLSCIDVGAVGLASPAAPVTPYFGVGYGIYRPAFDGGAALSWQGGVHFYGGAQFRLTDRLKLDAGLGVHLLRGEVLDQGLVAPAEATVRAKFAI